MRDSVAGAGLHAISAEDAAAVIDVIDLGVALRGTNALLGSVLRRLDVNTIRGTSRCAEEAGHTLLQAILVAPQNVNPAVAILKMHGLGRVVLRHRGSDHHLEGRGKPLRQR